MNRNVVLLQWHSRFLNDSLLSVFIRHNEGKKINSKNACRFVNGSQFSSITKRQHRKVFYVEECANLFLFFAPSLIIYDCWISFFFLSSIFFFFNLSQYLCSLQKCVFICTSICEFLATNSIGLASICEKCATVWFSYYHHLSPRTFANTKKKKKFKCLLVTGRKRNYNKNSFISEKKSALICLA